MKSANEIRIDRDELSVLLGHWDSGTGPLYRQLSDGLRKLFEIGRYEAGSHLPPERHLAKTLAVSRNTVASAYGELRKEGWVQARQGSATIVASANHLPAVSHRESGLFATLMRSTPEVLDLTIAVPHMAPIVSEILQAPSRFIDFDKHLSGHGFHALGLPDLREAVAERLTAKGLATTPDEVLITNGAQQAISLLVRALIRPGDGVAMDEVTYPGVMDAVTSSRGVIVPIKHGSEGTDTQDLEHLIGVENPRLLYVIPTFHNPAGVLMEGRARSELARVVTESGITVIDDLSLFDLDHSCEAPSLLAADAPDASVISVGSMSKVLWGGLRVGWIRAREPVIALLGSHKVSHDLGTSAVSQAIALAAFDHLDDVRQLRNQALAASCQTLGNELEDQLPSWSWVPPRGGPYAWMQIPYGDAAEFAQLALRRGVAVVPGLLLSARDGAASDCIRLPLYPTSKELTKAVTALASIWVEYSERLR